MCLSNLTRDISTEILVFLLWHFFSITGLRPCHRMTNLSWHALHLAVGETEAWKKLQHLNTNEPKNSSHTAFTVFLLMRVSSPSSTAWKPINLFWNNYFSSAAADKQNTVSWINNHKWRTCLEKVTFRTVNMKNFILAKSPVQNSEAENDRMAG